MVITNFMFFYDSKSIISIQNDAYNISHKRNVRNTNKGLYNCVGYALGLFSWYHPWDKKHRCAPSHASNDSLASINVRATKMVRYMLHERHLSNRIRQIESIADLLPNEYAVAFRCGYKDFHFIKRAKNGHWYSKMGNDNTIAQCHNVLDESIPWNDKYTSKIYLLAVC